MKIVEYLKGNYHEFITVIPENDETENEIINKLLDEGWKIYDTRFNRISAWRKINYKKENKEIKREDKDKEISKELLSFKMK